MVLREQRLTLWAVLLLLASFLASTDAIAATSLHDSSGSLTGLFDLVKNSAQQWDGKLKGYAERLFWILALIQFIWMFMPLVFKQVDLGETAGELTCLILAIGFFRALLQFVSEWAEVVVNSFRQAGTSAAGLGKTAIRPGDIFGTAIELANAIGNVETWSPLMMFMVALAGVLVLLRFTFIAVSMDLTIVESHAVINASVLFMSFGVSQWTREYVMAIVCYAVFVGVKLFILALIVGLIIDSAKQWQTVYNHDDVSMWMMIGLAFACVYFVKTIPELVTGMTSGVSAGGGSSIGGMAAAGAAGAVAAIAAIVMAGAAAPAAAGMMSAAGAGGVGAAGVAGVGAVDMGGLAGATNPSFAGAGSVGGAASSVGSMVSAGVGSSTGDSAVVKSASPAGSRVDGSTADSAPFAAPAQPSSGIQQAAKQVGKVAWSGDDDKSQAAPSSASQQGVSASSGDSSMPSSILSGSADTASGDIGSADSGTGGKDVPGRQVAEGVTRGLGLMSAIVVPGTESATDLSLGAGQPQLAPDGGNGDAPSMAPNSNSEPENVIHPADPVPPNGGGPKPGTKGED